MKKYILGATLASIVIGGTAFSAGSSAQRNKVAAVPPSGPSHGPSYVSPFAGPAAQDPAHSVSPAEELQALEQLAKDRADESEQVRVQEDLGSGTLTDGEVGGDAVDLDGVDEGGK